MIGTFAELNSGGPLPFVARLVDWNPNSHSFLCKWLWRPQDLPAGILTEARPLSSFGQAELLMCSEADASAGADWNPRDALLREHVRVLSYADWLQQASGDLSVYFYRQIYDVASQQLHMEHGSADSATGDSETLELFRTSDGRFVTANPDLRYFRCVGCGVVFDGEAVGRTNERKTRTSDASQEAECAVCAMQSWRSQQPPTDDKRKTVVDRLDAALSQAVAEGGGVSEFLGAVTATTNLASAVEAALARDLGALSKEYKTQARSLVFNLGDPKNPSLRRRVVSGNFPLWKLSRATADELASEATQQTREAEREKYFHEQVVVAAETASPRAAVTSLERGESPVSSGQRRAKPQETAVPAKTGRREAMERTVGNLLEEVAKLRSGEVAEEMRKFIASQV